MKAKQAEIRFIVAERVTPQSNNSEWTWTAWAGGGPVCRAEYSWRTAASARRDARKFRTLIGRPDAEIRTAGT